MANTLSEYFTDEDLERQLRMQFDINQQYTMNFKTVFNQIQDIGDCFMLRLRNRIFYIDKITGVVTEKDDGGLE